MGLLAKHRYVCDYYYFKLSYLLNESSVYVCECVCLYIHIYVYADICVYMYAFDSKTTVYYTHKNICYYVIWIMSAVLGLRITIYILYNIHLVKYYILCFYHIYNFFYHITLMLYFTRGRINCSEF